MTKIALVFPFYVIFTSVTFSQVGVSYPDTATQRGFLPAGSYQFSQLETIDKASGNLSYNIPITSMPIGRGGLTLPVTLSYNSTQFDYSYQPIQLPIGTDAIQKNLTPSPWSGFTLGYQYSLYTEGNFNGNTTTQPCTLRAGRNRTSLVTPDGSRHVLFYPGYPQGFQGPDGFYPWDAEGNFNCPYANYAFTPLSLPLTMVTTDGSYIRVTFNADHTWTAYLRDGKKITTAPMAYAGAPVALETITDPDGNKITITNGMMSNVPQTVIKDDLGRTITLGWNAGMTRQQITQTGFANQPLVWSFGPVSGLDSNGNTPTPFTFTYRCVDQQTFTTSQGPYTVQPQACSTGASAPYPWTLDVPGDMPAGATGVQPTTLEYYFTFGARSGLLTSVKLPTGALVSYSYQINDYTQAEIRNDLLNPVISKTVTWNDTADGVVTPRIETWSYSGYGSDGNRTFSFSVTNPDKGVEISQLNAPINTSTLSLTQPSGTTESYFYQCGYVPDIVLSLGCTNPIIAAEAHTIPSAGKPALTSLKFFRTDLNGNQTSALTYDWAAYSSAYQSTPNGAIPPAPSSKLLETVQNTYSSQTADALSAANDGNAYWNTGAPQFLSQLRRSATTGTGTGALVERAYKTDGKLQQERHWDSTKAAVMPTTLDSLNASNASVTQYSYDGFGNLTQIIDPNGVATNVTLDQFNLYPGTVVAAAGTPVARTYAYIWDYNLGLRTKVTDVDNNVQTLYSYDAEGHPTNVTEASNITASTRQTNTIYDDANLRMIVKHDKASNGDGLLVNVTTYDQLGRVALTQQLENAGTQSPTDRTAGIKIMTRYVFSGANSYKLTSNPFRAATSAAASIESTMGWTLTAFDQDGRTTTTQTFAGAGQPAPFGSTTGTSTGMITTQYNTPNSQSTRVIDQANNQKDSAVDGLSRLASITEYPSSGLTYTTTYSYDVLGDLIGINQSGLTRTFGYNSLKRLIGSKNPENYTALHQASQTCSDGGTYAICYYYDASGNLLTKTDNRPTTVTSVYDQLNRIRSKSYSDGLTSTVSYTYGTVASPSGSYSIGRLLTVANGNSTATYGNFDPLGRAQASTQTTGGQTYSFSYQYNASDLITAKYPSGRVITTSYDGANRQLSVSGLIGTNATNYASNVLYAAHGVVLSYQYAQTSSNQASKMFRQNSYNTRLQLGGYTETNTATGVQLVNAQLNWGGTNNNGNLLGATYVNNGTGSPASLTFSQTYGYDGVDRLNSAIDMTGTTTNWARNFGFDAFGNMWVTASSGIGPAGNTPVNNVYNANNQIGNASYDAAGNQLSVNGNTQQYDGESRQISVVFAGASEEYLYDGNGKRVEKSGPNGTTVFVYDAMGELAAEYSTATNTSPCSTCYLSSDHLGSTRMVLDGSGNVIARHDYLPFGEEIAANTAGRNQQWGAGNDFVNQKFTGKERDSESGLDYFGARYYGSSLGRFTSPDWSAIPDAVPYANFANPQTLNQFTYVLNNPLRSIDADGHYEVNASHCLLNPEKCQKKYDKAAAKFERRREKDLLSKKAAVRAAAAAYGAPGEANGVHVSFANLSNEGINGKVGPTGTSPLDMGVQVTIDFGRAGSAETQTHEGTHVIDDLKFLNSWTPATGYDQTLNITHGQTEFNAFKAGAEVDSEHGFGPKDDRKIWEFLRNSPTYGPILNKPVFDASRFPAGASNEDQQ